MLASAAAVLAHQLTVAPMMKHTHSHFRVLMRVINPDAVLFTEMAHADAIVANAAIASKEQLAVVRKSSLEVQADSTTVLQLGGRDPSTLARAAQIMVDDLGLYTHVDLNCGCPSQIVAANQKMGAWLMREPEVAAACVAKIHSTCSSRLEGLSVKCRIGVSVNGHDGDEKLDDRQMYEQLLRFVSLVSEAGAKRVYIHARVAILGQTPMQNRIPALQYDMVYAIAKHFHPHVCIEINGGIESLLHVHEHARLCPQLAGSMVGRAIVNHPFSFKSTNTTAPFLTRANVLDQYTQYCMSLAPDESDAEVSRIVAPIYSLFEGEEGNASFRRKLEKCLARGVRSPSKIISEAVKEIPRHVLTSTGFKSMNDIKKDAFWIDVSKKRVSPMHGLIV